MYFNSFLKIITIIPIHIFLFLGLAISQSVENFNGVQIIKNDDVKTEEIKGNDYLEFVRIIGKYDSVEDTNLIFFIPSDILIDEDNNLYVLDSGNYTVKKFTQDLDLITCIGRKGKGPGEFLFPTNLEILENSRLIISDQRLSKFEVFDLKGNWIEQFQIKDNHSGKFCVNANNQLILFGQMNLSPLKSNNNSNIESYLLEIYDNRQKIKEFVRNISSGNQLVASIVNQFNISIDNHNNVYIAYCFLNRIDKYSLNGDLLFRIERPFSYKIQDLTKEKLKTLNPKEIKSFFAKINKTSIDLANDEKGRIWVLKPNRLPKKEEKSQLDLSGLLGVRPNLQIKKNISSAIDQTNMYDIELFDNSGILQTKIRLNHYVNKIEIYKNSLFLIDSYHSMQIYEYKILNL